MFMGFPEETVSFFLDLKFHNSSAFFHEYHERYVEAVQRPFYELAEELAPTMLEIDSMMEVRPYKCLSRIHRDTRFSRDKSPYRDHAWLLFRRAAEPREKSLFYYFEFGPDRLSWGMGFWGENREVMEQFRRKVVSNPNGISSLLRDMNLERHSLVRGGSSFKRLPVPEGVPSHLRPWYLSKELYIGKYLPDERLVYTDRLVPILKSDFKAMAPLYRLFRGYADELQKEKG